MSIETGGRTDDDLDPRDADRREIIEQYEESFRKVAQTDTRLGNRVQELLETEGFDVSQ